MNPTKLVISSPEKEVHTYTYIVTLFNECSFSPYRCVQERCQIMNDSSSLFKAPGTSKAISQIVHTSHSTLCETEGEGAQKDINVQKLLPPFFFGA